MKCAPYDPIGRAESCLRRPAWMTAQPNQKHWLSKTTIIASPKGVAIYRYALRNRTICQEIPTVASLPRNDNGESWCEGIENAPGWFRGQVIGVKDSKNQCLR